MLRTLITSDILEKCDVKNNLLKIMKNETDTCFFTALCLSLFACGHESSEFDYEWKESEQKNIFCRQI